MDGIEHQIDFEAAMEIERTADLEIINRISRGLSGMAETDYVINKFEELRRLKYGHSPAAS